MRRAGLGVQSAGKISLRLLPQSPLTQGMQHETSTALFQSQARHEPPQKERPLPGPNKTVTVKQVPSDSGLFTGFEPLFHAALGCK